MDFLGKKGKFHRVKKQKTYENFDSENEEPTGKVSPERNQGINIPTTEKPQNDYYSDESESDFNGRFASVLTALDLRELSNNESTAS